MTEFKQIVGRGTRLHADTGKDYFTLVDFRQATKHFADPKFDGEPVQIYEPGEDDPPLPPEPPEAPPGGDPDSPEGPGQNTGQGGGLRRKYYIKGRPVLVLSERVQYLDEQGKLVTESLRDYTRRLVRQQYADLDGFLRRWRGEERKQVILQELAEEGLLLEALQDEVGRELDPFDLICHIAYDQPPLSRAQRAARIRRDVFSRYGSQARAVLEALLDKYATEGVVDELDNVRILAIPPFSQMGTPLQLIREFGGKGGFESAVHELQSELYREAA
jgi:type I restriction enzyme R subunit